MLAVLVAAVSVQAQQPAVIPSPQGIRTENGLAGFGKILCSGVFVSGRAPADVVHGSAYFFMPAAERDLVKWRVDREAKRAYASLGSTTLIPSTTAPGLHFTPVGNFLIAGYDYGTERNWARIGMLYAQDGMWMGQRILPEGWSMFVSTPAPAWRRPEYGGQFWINGINTWNLPADTYFAAGAGGQNTWIVPGHDLVIVRMGHMRGQGPARQATNTALGLVMKAIGGATSP